MFIRDPFDVAPHASRNARASWIALVLGVVFVLVSGLLLARSVNVLRQTEDATRVQREFQQAQAEREAAARLKQNGPAALEKLRAQQKVQAMLRLSWFGLFDALESAGGQVKGRTTILSLAPVKTQADTAEVSLTGLAVSSQVMIEYIRALETHPQVREVQLLMQQPAPSSDAQLVKFQLSVFWQPDCDISARQAAQGVSDARQLK